MLVGVLVTVGFLVVVAALLVGAWFVMRRPSARGSAAPGSGMLSAGLDQLWHPQAVRAREILDTEQRLVVEVPAPDPLDRLRAPVPGDGATER